MFDGILKVLGENGIDIRIIDIANHNSSQHDQIDYNNSNFQYYNTVSIIHFLINTYPVFYMFESWCIVINISK